MFFWQFFYDAVINHKRILSVNQFINPGDFLHKHWPFLCMGKNVHQRRDKKRKASIREAGPPAGEQPETRKSSGGTEGTLYVVA
ncbi:MAG: hypothetical protein ABIJ57_10775, partial [Pseudomonadota bacterium]